MHLHSHAYSVAPSIGLNIMFDLVLGRPNTAATMLAMNIAGHEPTWTRMSWIGMTAQANPTLLVQEY